MSPPPSLNNDILEEIFYEAFIQPKIRSNNKMGYINEQKLFKFGLIGKEFLNVLMKFLRGAKSCTIDSDYYLIEFNNSVMNNPRLAFDLPPFLECIMKAVGENIHSLKIHDDGPSVQPLLNAICESKQLKHIEMEYSIGVNAFEDCLNACSETIKTIRLTSCYPFLNVEGLNADEVIIESDFDYGLSEFLQTKCCRTQKLVLDLYEFHGGQIDLNQLVQSFSVNNEALASVKELMVFIESYCNEQELNISDFLAIIDGAFPSLEKLSILKDLRSLVLSDLKTHYDEFRQQLEDAKQKFKIYVQWTIAKNCNNFEDFKDYMKLHLPMFEVIKEGSALQNYAYKENINDSKELDFNLEFLLVKDVNWEPEDCVKHLNKFQI